MTILTCEILANVDPRLLAKIKKSKSEETIKAVFSLVKPSSEEAAANEQKIIDEILDKTKKSAKEKPSNVKYLPRVGILIVEGNSKLLQKIIQSPKISSATISDETDFYLA